MEWTWTILKVKAEDEKLVPKHANEGDAGLDLRAKEPVLIEPGKTGRVGTGLKMAIPEGYFGMVAPRSGLAAKHGITMANTPGIVDSGYRGEVKLPLHNLSNRPYVVEEGERVAQMILVPYISAKCRQVDDLGETERGTGGFGSTGKE